MKPLLIIVHLLVFLKCISCNEDLTMIVPGKCKKLWRHDELKGRCFGLTVYNQYKSLKGTSLNVTSASTCRAVCCNLGEECVSWQFESTLSVCKIGGKVRLGLEASGTSEWCDPYPVADWNGKKLKIRHSDGTCEWGEPLIKQCFGLGDEQFKDVDRKEKLDTAGCEKACCESTDCDYWQEISGRGCFYHNKQGVSCSSEPRMIYTGARKCLPGYCGGHELRHNIALASSLNSSQPITITTVS